MLGTAIQLLVNLDSFRIKKELLKFKPSIWMVISITFNGMSFAEGADLLGFSSTTISNI